MVSSRRARSRTIVAAFSILGVNIGVRHILPVYPALVIAAALGARFAAEDNLGEETRVIGQLSGELEEDADLLAQTPCAESCGTFTGELPFEFVFVEINSGANSRRHNLQWDSELVKAWDAL